MTSLPVSGRSSAYENQFEDTWDKYDLSKLQLEGGSKPNHEKNIFTNGVKASLQNITKAYFDTNVFESLGDRLTTSETSRRNLKFSMPGRSVDVSHDENILPLSMKHTNETIDDHYLGSLRSGVPTVVKTDKTFTNVLGETKYICESPMPPPNKDYTNTAKNSSNRDLERLQGYRMEEEKRKVEVVGEINPGEDPNHLMESAHRNQVTRVSSRDTFFNRSHAGDLQSMETSRKDLYDGHNMKPRMTVPVQPCWRDQQSKPTQKRHDGTWMLPAKTNPNKDAMRRTELSPAYARIASGAISARHAPLSLPIIPEATMRASPTIFTSRKEKGSFEAKRVDSAGDHLEKAALPQMDPKSPATETNAHMVHPMSDAPSVKEGRQEVMVPMGSKEYEIAARIAQEIKLAEGDDSEVSSILLNSRETAPVRVPLQNNFTGDADHIYHDTVTMQAPQIPDKNVVVSARKMEISNVPLSDADTKEATYLPVMDTFESDVIRHDKDHYNVGEKDVTRVDSMLKPQILSSQPLPQEVKIERKDVVPVERKSEDLMYEIKAENPNVSIYHRKDISRVDRVREEPSSSFATMNARGLTQMDQELETMRQNAAVAPSVDQIFSGDIQKERTEYPINEERANATTEPVGFMASRKIVPSDHEEIHRIEEPSFARTNSGFHPNSKIPQQSMFAGDHILPERAASVPLKLPQGGGTHEQTLRPILTPSTGSSGTMNVYRPSPKRSFTSQPDPRMNMRSNSVTNEIERLTPVRFGMGDGGSTRVTPTIQYSSRRETPFNN